MQTQENQSLATPPLFATLSYRQVQTYGFAFLFIAGNLLLPYTLHQFHLAGPTWLPIYFFTLIGAYKYGWKVGLLIALASPILNHLFTGMPASFVLPGILCKSVLLAIASGYIAHHFQKVNLLLLLLIVLFYQIGGSLFEGFWFGSFSAAYADLRIGFPGLICQVFVGFALLKALSSR